jgi:hypothetical protein
MKYKGYKLVLAYQLVRKVILSVAILTEQELCILGDGQHP